MGLAGKHSSVVMEMCRAARLSLGLFFTGLREPAIQLRLKRDDGAA